jgi:hypothetical protein
MTTSGIFNQIIGEALGITTGIKGSGGLMHRYVFDLQKTGLIGKRSHGFGAYHWRTSDASNLLIAAASGCQLQDIAGDTAAIRRLPAHDWGPVHGFTWPAEGLFGGALDRLIDDFRAERFEFARESGQFAKVSVAFIDEGVRAIIRLETPDRIIERVYSHEFQCRGQQFSVARTLTCGIRRHTHPTLLEKIATALGPDTISSVI